MEESPQISLRQACGSCKKQKRKCDKEFPVCGFCAHTKRKCEYEDAPEKPPSASDFAALQLRLAKLEERLLTSNPKLRAESTDADDNTSQSPGSFTSRPTKDIDSVSLDALFLDVDCYTWTGLQLPRPQMQLPMVSLSCRNCSPLDQNQLQSLRQWTKISRMWCLSSRKMKMPLSGFRMLTSTPFTTGCPLCLGREWTSASPSKVAGQMSPCCFWR